MVTGEDGEVEDVPAVAEELEDPVAQERHRQLHGEELSSFYCSCLSSSYHFIIIIIIIIIIITIIIIIYYYDYYKYHF